MHFSQVRHYAILFLTNASQMAHTGSVRVLQSVPSSLHARPDAGTSSLISGSDDGYLRVSSVSTRKAPPPPSSSSSSETTDAEAPQVDENAPQVDDENERVSCQQRSASIITKVARDHHNEYVRGAAVRKTSDAGRVLLYSVGWDYALRVLPVDLCAQTGH